MKNLNQLGRLKIMSPDKRHDQDSILYPITEMGLSIEIEYPLRRVIPKSGPMLPECRAAQMKHGYDRADFGL